MANTDKDKHKHKDKHKDKGHCQLGSHPGFSENDEANPVENMLAISQWHAALSRVIAYVWDRWDDEQEINNVLRYPEYYLIKFGFFPQIPAYQTKIKFVIKNDDTVMFKYGGPHEDCKAIHHDCSTHEQDGATVTVIPQGDKSNAISSTMNRAMEYRSTTNEYTAGLVPLSSYKDIAAEVSRVTGICASELANGWQFNDVNELTGCFIVAIPPKPQVSSDSQADSDLLQTQALNDFMDICRSQPFTCC